MRKLTAAVLFSAIVAVSATRPAAAQEPDELRADLAERERLKPWHILFGNLTWAATNVSTVLGFLHFNDRYGWDGDPMSTGCERGSPILGTDFCTGVPTPHAISTTLLTVFFGSAFTVALFMPDPLDVGDGDGTLARRVTIHRALRWGLLGLLVVQIALGAIVANAGIMDFDTKRALAITHLALGSLTWAGTTAQGVLGSLLAY